MNKRRFKGFDYEAVNHPDLVRRAPERPVSAGEWVHLGGGWYENTVTLERRKGTPD